MTQTIQNILHASSTGNRCRKIRNHPYSKLTLRQTFTHSFIHTNDAISPSDLNIFLPAAGAFFLIYFLLRRGGPAELQSCNFRAYKYFTGNDCGKPRKRHRLSNALSIYIYCAFCSCCWLTVMHITSLMTFHCLFTQQTGEQLTC